jgi:superfamily II DNA or RNA helicase
MGTYVSATADPVKNDASEAFDVLQKMDPARYADRDAFMRKYGVDTASARDGLQREMARHFYTGGIDPGVKVDRKQVSVQLDDGQRAHLKALDDAAAAGRLARLRGDVDVDAMKVLSPNSFDGVDPGQARAVAENLQNSIGIVHNSAVHHTINGGAKIGAIAKIANERRGKQGVVFAHHRDHVAAIAAQLKAEGHRVVTLTGSDSAKDKDRIKAEYKAGKHDVLVCSDAAAVGANLQTGRWLAQADTPLTAMLHAQRNGRIHRIGQNNDVELLDVVADHPAERRARARLTTKYDLRDVMTSPLEGLDDRGLAGYLNRVRAGKEEAAETVHADMPVPANDAEPAEPDQQRSMF